MNRLILSGAVALALAAAGAFWLTSSASRTTQTTAIEEGGLLPNGAANAQEGEAEIDTSSVVEMALGPEDAEVTLVEYASFTCPHCANFHKNQFQQLKADYIDTGKIRFVYRDVYFDPYGLWAAMVARCGGPDKFFGIADMIYYQQKDWIGDGDDQVAIANNLRKIGKVAGLEEAELQACLSDNAHAKTLVAWYQENATADSVNSTPTLIINGEKHSNMDYDDLKQIIDELLAE